MENYIPSRSAELSTDMRRISAVSTYKSSKVPRKLVGENDDQRRGISIDKGGGIVQGDILDYMLSVKY